MRADLPQIVAAVLGAVFVLIGLLGFVVTGFSSLVGTSGVLVLFALTPLHNLAHLLIGAFWLVSAARVDTARSATQIFGIVYLLLSAFGFLQVGAALSALALNTPDNFLHLIAGVLAVYLGFFSPPAREAEV